LFAIVGCRRHLARALAPAGRVDQVRARLEPRPVAKDLGDDGRIGVRNERVVAEAVGDG
jgi:hypothetical protein